MDQPKYDHSKYNRDAYDVPFSQFRPGAVIEFRPGYGKPQQGTVKSLTLYGARNFLAVLSQVVDGDGTLHVGDCLYTGRRTINLCHATRVISHGTGKLDFELDKYNDTRTSDEVKKYREKGVVARRGKRLVIDGTHEYAPNVVRDIVFDTIVRNRKVLGILPWDILDLDPLLAALVKSDIVHYVYKTREDAWDNHRFAVRGHIQTEKLARFLKRNINRFKCDLRAAEREHNKDEEAFQREEEARDIERSRRYGTYA